MCTAVLLNRKLIEKKTEVAKSGRSECRWLWSLVSELIASRIDHQIENDQWASNCVHPPDRTDGPLHGELVQKVEVLLGHRRDAAGWRMAANPNGPVCTDLSSESGSLQFSKLSLLV